MKNKLKKIIDKFDIINYLSSKFDTKPGKHDQIRVLCPLCAEIIGEPDTNYHLEFNISTKVWHCFRCNSSGTLFDFIKLSEKVSFVEAVNIVKYSENYHLSKEDAKNKVIEKLEKKIKFIGLPKVYMPINYDKNLPNMVKKYLQKRKLDIDTCIEYKIGYCQYGDYMHRLIVPIIFNNKIATFIARAMIKSKKKKLYPVGSTTGKILFNWDVAKQKKDLVICEGVFDAIRIGESAVALLGSSMSEDQLKLIRNEQFNNVYVCLDKDAIKKTKSIFSKLASYFDTYIVRMPTIKKDPADYTRQQIWDIIYTRSKNFFSNH